MPSKKNHNLISAEIVNIAAQIRQRFIDEFGYDREEGWVPDDEDRVYAIENLSLPSNRLLLRNPIPFRRCAGMRMYSYKNEKGNIDYLLSVETSICPFLKSKFYKNEMKLVDEILDGTIEDKQHCYCSLFPNEDLNISEYELYDCTTNDVVREEEGYIYLAPSKNLSDELLSSLDALLSDKNSSKKNSIHDSIQINRCSKCISNADFINDLIKSIINNNF